MANLALAEALENIQAASGTWPYGLVQHKHTMKLRKGVIAFLTHS